MGAVLSAASSSQGPAVTEPEPAVAEEPQEELEPFEIHLVSISGDQKTISVYPNSSVDVLQKLAAQQFNWQNPWSITFAHGSTALKDPEMTLQQLGLTEPCELMVLRREPWCLKQLGQSRYNRDYLCSILELREVGASDLELDFRAEGDASLGPLQKAERSMLIWEAEGDQEPVTSLEDLVMYLEGGIDPGRFRKARPCPVTFKVNNERLKEGTMRFSGVPTAGKVSFIFGEGGYSQLNMIIGPEAANAQMRNEKLEAAS